MNIPGGFIEDQLKLILTNYDTDFYSDEDVFEIIRIRSRKSKLNMFDWFDFAIDFFELRDHVGYEATKARLLCYQTNLALLTIGDLTYNI